MKATTAIFIDKYHPKSDETCAISIRVTYDRKKKYYATKYAMTEGDFDRMKGAKPRGDLKDLKLKLNTEESKAAKVIEGLPFFTWAGFEKGYLSNRAASDTIDYAFSEYAKKLREEERIGTAVSYECAKRSFEMFQPGLKFIDITPDLLSKYERWMLGEKKNSVTTVGIYLRSLRTLFNSMISDGLLSLTVYPFGKNRYEIPTANNIKKALSLSEIGSIYNYRSEPGSNSERSKDYWLFMYFCNGMNVKDMCLLKYSNIKGEVLEFDRAKTIRTKRKVESIRVVLSEDAKSIIDRQGNRPKSDDQYIFPVLSKGLTPDRERQLIQQVTQLVNHHMKDIAKDLKISSEITTYAARHSFATILQRSGASTSLISEALGHSDVKTTQNYLAGFEDEAKKEALKALTAFKNK